MEAAPLLYDAHGRPYADAVPVHTPHGAILVDGVQVADTVRCVHCGGHFVMQAGSRRVRGWCPSCHGLVCGPSCAVCVPFEQKLDLADGG